MENGRDDKFPVYSEDWKGGAGSPLPQVYHQPPSYANVREENLPEVVPHDWGRGAHYPEVSSFQDVKPGHGADIELRTAASSHSHQPVLSGDGTSKEPESGYQPPPSSQIAPWRRLRRWWLIPVGLAVLVVVIAGVVVGVVVSRKSSYSGDGSPAQVSGDAAQQSSTAISSSLAASATSSSSVSSSTPAATVSGAPISTVASIAGAVNLLANGSPDIQVFYRADPTTDLQYRVYLAGGSFGDTGSTIKLTVPLASGAPMTLAARNGTDGSILLNLFYLKSSGSSADIAMSAITCPKGQQTCAETQSVIVTKNVTGTSAVHPQSSVTAMWIDNNFGFRVYFQSLSGGIFELSGSSTVANAPWKGSIVTGPAVNGTSLTSTFSPGPAISVYYTAQDTNELTEGFYNGHWDGNVRTVDSSALAGWTSAAPLAACYMPSPKTYVLFYVTPSTGQIVGYKRTATATAWTRVSTDPAWVVADFGVMVVGWADQMRMLYMSKGVLVQGAYSNSKWTTGVVN